MGENDVCGITLSLYRDQASGMDITDNHAAIVKIHGNFNQPHIVQKTSLTKHCLCTNYQFQTLCLFFILKILIFFQAGADEMPPYFVFLTMMSFYIFLQEKVITRIDILYFGNQA